ncbi:protein FAR1-RELATED SEQUENCE 12-like [Solanum tuberosum]|nr:PREDICTED: protein FAR1-RELATED SEQUENCE 12-like [Solanum tuberosum]XP_006339066.1 PREDICTED: protein FAR1-RELATED SEQUENCE 12-like [Solanum tuberosum]XP_015165072.1 PREDICTED: protein FAR1-RELATED SEQUENCE 12-like [Solanum tuberosum]
MSREEIVNTMTVRAKPAAGLAIATIVKNNGHHRDIDEEGESRLEPNVGLEFDSAEDAQEFYNLYATKIGFRIRIGQLYRSRIDGSVVSRRFVCSKEGFQTTSRTGCPAFIRVQRLDSGKWVLANIKKEHNHELEHPGEICPSRIQRKIVTPTPTPTPKSKSASVLSTRTGLRSLDEDGPSGILDFKRLKREKINGETKSEPYKGLEFVSAGEAYEFYHTHAANTGFKVRIGQLFRSKNDGSITSRRFVCSKEGHQHPSRVGCGAFMRIQRQESGRWLVDRFQNEHNHELGAPIDASERVSSKGFKEELSHGLENMDLVESNGGFSLVTRSRESKIGSDWYNELFDYFQARQAEDMGFFYAVEMHKGRAMSVLWADSRSRFSCTQFGDAIVFDTTYRRGSYSVPLASFIGVNHHRQPVLLGCALIAEESEESFTWLFQAWLRAMSGRRPISIVADQDWVIQHSIAQVFPGTHHRFSAWQVVAKEQENIGALLSMNPEFKYEYETCIFQSQTANEFEAAWNVLINKYNMRENTWLKDMYRMRKSWVPLYIKGTFFAGIPTDGSLKSYFGTILTSQAPLSEFLIRYEKALEQRREEERKEDFNSFNLQAVLHTKDPIEDQCRRLYTITTFKVFQKELLECYSYVGIKINVEGAISRYLVQKCGNGDERNTVAFNASNINISCSCKMFEFEGVLCRHALKVFQIMNIRELPSRYILHRWTKDAKYGILRDVDSGGASQDHKALMSWSLREEAKNYIEAGTASLERYKLAFEIMQEGRRNLCWQN